MHGQHRNRVPSFLAVGLLAVVPTVGFAQTPTTVADIEIYQGTRKVSPKLLDAAAGPKAAAALASTLQDATHSALASTGNVIARILDRSMPKWEAPRLPVVVNITLPQPAGSPMMTAGGIQQVAASGSGTPGLLPWAYANAVRDAVPPPREESKPTVIIVREAAPAVALPEPAGVRISTETLLVALGGILVGLGAMLWRSRTPATAVAKPPATHATIRGLDIGPLPDTAEKFDLGPTYAEGLAHEKATEKAGETAILQHILEQNLTMRAEIASDPVPTLIPGV